MKEIGIYVHIPFCKRKCYYCDFCSYEENSKVHAEYVSALTNEISNFKINEISEKMLCNKSVENNASIIKEKKQDNTLKKEELIVKTIYIGGGTPSIIDENHVKKIIEEIRKKFTIEPDAEITIEVNPGTASYEKLSLYKKIGINRLSIGLQSTNDKLLTTIGRIHNYNQFEEVYEMARKVGFLNINVDLMIGLPTQTIKDVEESLNAIINKNPEHISVYSLILEDETKLKTLVEEKKLELPSEDIEREMYWKVKETLQKNNYKHYEISNFSKEGYESKHNTDCWKQKEYFGFGLAAHSYYNGIRYSNTSNLNKYIKNCKEDKYIENRNLEEIQNEQIKLNEFVILGLRMIDGFSKDEFYKKFGRKFEDAYSSQILELEEKGLLSVECTNVKLTNKGIDFANIVWGEFLC